MKKQIMLLEDKPSIGKSILSNLSDSFEFQFFRSPINAICQIQEGYIPDLIISNIDSRKMHVEDFLNFIRRNDLLSHIPIIRLPRKEHGNIETTQFTGKEESNSFVETLDSEDLEAWIKKILETGDFQN